MPDPALIHTIGHSNLTLEQFLDRLRAAGIDTVVDVRAQPVSRSLNTGPGGTVTPFDALEPQTEMFAELKPWRSPQSVLHKVQRSTSSSGFEPPA